jgi:hypothetical protein
MDQVEVLSICGSSAAANAQIGHLPRWSDRAAFFWFTIRADEGGWQE